jgi:hypothetical protein
MILVLQSARRTARINLRLDFAEEKLHFEPTVDLSASDRGTAESAEDMADIKRFFRDFVGNGQLHIYNAETGTLIARKDAYMPMNMMLDYKAVTEEIDSWKRIAEWRRTRSASVENEIVQKCGDVFLSVSVTFKPTQF